MDRVLIVCGAGASSTFLALRLRRAARNRDLDLTVEAGSLPELDEQLADARILLVGPHLAPRFDDLKQRADEAGARTALLPDTVFGPEGAELAADLVTDLLTARAGAENMLKAEPIQGD